MRIRTIIYFPVFAYVITAMAICQYLYVNSNILFPVHKALEGRDLSSVQYLSCHFNLNLLLIIFI